MAWWKVPISHNKLIPEICACYALYAGSRLIYIGQSGNLKRRIPAHAKVPGITSVKFKPCKFGEEASLEKKLIRRLRPPLNKGATASEGVRIGLRLAKEKGVVLGRPKVVLNLEVLRTKYAAGISIRRLAAEFGASPMTIQRSLRGSR